MTTEPTTTPGPEVVLHEERVHVDVERGAVRAIVRRRVVTEVRTVEVTVRREVLEVEHVPADGLALPSSGEPRTQVELLLSEEVPVVTLQVQPYERVTVGVETVTDQERVSTDVSQERVELTTTFPV